MNPGTTRLGYAFSLPAIVFMAALIGYPLVDNLLLSFQSVDVMSFADPDHPFVGWQTYQQLFSDPTTLTALGNTFVFTLACLVIQFTGGFLLALFFHRGFRFAGQLRGLMVVSWMLPMTVTALIFKFMLSPGDGVLNYLLLQWGWIREPIGWLVDPSTAMAGVVIANAWVGIPFNMILMATALSTIPKTLYESASIDGASAWTTFRVIVVPYVWSAVLATLVLGFVYTFKVFDLIYVMTGGGPVNATEVLSTVSYRYSFTQFNFSLGAAAANVLFVVLLAIGLVYIALTRKEEKY